MVSPKFSKLVLWKYFFNGKSFLKDSMKPIDLDRKAKKKFVKTHRTFYKIFFTRKFISKNLWCFHKNHFPKKFLFLEKNPWNFDVKFLSEEISFLKTRETFSEILFPKTRKFFIKNFFPGKLVLQNSWSGFKNFCFPRKVLS